jgi:hypothetical protein
MNQPTDLPRVVAYLEAQERDGKLNDFTDSLLRYYRSKGGLTPKQIAAIVKKLDAPAQPARPTCTAPSGRYAVQAIDEMFLVRLWRGTRNPDYTCLYEHDTGDRITGPLEPLLLAAISKDPAGAAEEFGHRTGTCYRCGTELLKNLSRKLGMGPDCMKHLFDREVRLARLAQARQELRDAGLDPEALNDNLSVAA